MSKKVAVNKKVAITAVSFRQKNGLTGFPKRMEFEGATYFFQGGLQCLVKKGKEVIRIFDMTDGNSTYRLRCDENQCSWTLMAMSQGDE